MPPKRLQLFAGPNGSGKTNIPERIPKELNFGYIVNADNIAGFIRVKQFDNVKFNCWTNTTFVS